MKTQQPRSRGGRPRLARGSRSKLRLTPPDGGHPEAPPGVTPALPHHAPGSARRGVTLHRHRSPRLPAVHGREGPTRANGSRKQVAACHDYMHSSSWCAVTRTSCVLAWTWHSRRDPDLSLPHAGGDLASLPGAKAAGPGRPCVVATAFRADSGISGGRVWLLPARQAVRVARPSEGLRRGRTPVWPVARCTGARWMEFNQAARPVLRVTCILCVILHLRMSKNGDGYNLS